jgi:hypothetical protein
MVNSFIGSYNHLHKTAYILMSAAQSFCHFTPGDLHNLMSESGYRVPLSMIINVLAALLG